MYRPAFILSIALSSSMLVPAYADRTPGALLLGNTDGLAENDPIATSENQPSYSNTPYQVVALSAPHGEPDQSEPYTKKSFPPTSPPPKPGPLAGCTYGSEIEVWRKDAMITGNSWDHTATETTIYAYCPDAPRRIFKRMAKCNHGACPKGEGMRKIHSYTSPSRFTAPLEPVGCDHFSKDYQALTKPKQVLNYGIWGERHVCNNDTFLQMGEIVTGKLPDNKTVTRICRNKNYEKHTGRDAKYAPSFENVKAYIANWGWNPNTAPAVGGATSVPRTPKRLP